MEIGVRLIRGGFRPSRHAGAHRPHSAAAHRPTVDGQLSGSSGPPGCALAARRSGRARLSPPGDGARPPSPRSTNACPTTPSTPSTPASPPADVAFGDQDDLLSGRPAGGPRDGAAPAAAGRPHDRHLPRDGTRGERRTRRGPRVLHRAQRPLPHAPQGHRRGARPRGHARLSAPAGPVVPRHARQRDPHRHRRRPISARAGCCWTPTARTRVSRRSSAISPRRSSATCSPSGRSPSARTRRPWFTSPQAYTAYTTGLARARRDERQPPLAAAGWAGRRRYAKDRRHARGAGAGAARRPRAVPSRVRASRTGGRAAAGVVPLPHLPPADPRPGPRPDAGAVRAVPDGAGVRHLTGRGGTAGAVYVEGPCEGATRPLRGAREAGTLRPGASRGAFTEWTTGSGRPLSGPVRSARQVGVPEGRRRSGRACGQVGAFRCAARRRRPCRRSPRRAGRPGPGLREEFGSTALHWAAPLRRAAEEIRSPAVRPCRMPARTRSPGAHEQDVDVRAVCVHGSATAAGACRGARSRPVRVRSSAVSGRVSGEGERLGGKYQSSCAVGASVDGGYRLRRTAAGEVSVRSPVAAFGATARTLTLLEQDLRSRAPSRSCAQGAAVR